jgi:hypothetical protein
MTNTKHLLLAVILATPLTVLADEGAINDATEAGVQHEMYHEPLHIGDTAKHAKGSQGFAKADKNKDGKLTREEAKAAPHIYKHFDEIDADKDSTVDRDEVHIYMKEHKGK